MSVAKDIEDGMATILWGDAWASHVEEHRCSSLSGRRIEDVMPPVPREARKLAGELRKKFESANGTTVAKLYERAEAADEAGRKEGGRYKQADPEAFGQDLAFQALGHGVSWFDDHAEFTIKFPHIENYDLQFIAESRCKA